MQLPVLSTNIMNWIQVSSWAAAVFTAILAVGKILLYDRPKDRQQRADDLAKQEATADKDRKQRHGELMWKRAQAAKTLNDELIADPLADAAMTMLDWSGRTYVIHDGEKVVITKEEFLRALRTTNAFSAKEAYIRDAVDRLLYHMGVFEHYIARTLVVFDDISHPVDYYVRKMAEHRQIFETYIKTYHFRRTGPFLNRFDEWRQASTS